MPNAPESQPRPEEEAPPSPRGSRAPGWVYPGDLVAVSRLAQNVGLAFQSVYPGWGVSTGRGNQGSLTERVVEAQLAAAALGSKPLYFDGWGEEFSGIMAEVLRPLLPPGSEIHARSGNLYVYRPEIVRPILDSDLPFYRPQGQGDLEAIDRASTRGTNGELLGYGAREDRKDLFWSVLVHAPLHQEVLLYYASTQEQARATARMRTAEISAHLEMRLVYEIHPPLRRKA